MEKFKVVGKPLPRLDAGEKVSGEGKFSADIYLPGMLWGKILRSSHPHARVLHVDVNRARRLPGVKAVLTGKDVAHIRYAFVDTPRYPADQNPLAVTKARYIGDELAAVAAVDEATAEEALSLIRVDLEPLPAVFHPEKALLPDAPLVHELDYRGKTVWEEWGASGRGEFEPVRRGDNISARTSVSFGDVEKGLNQSHHVRQDRFETPATAHCALEPHVAVASFDLSGKLTIHLSSMGIFYKRFILAKVLGLPLGKVRIVKTYVGGAFGGKIDLFPYEILAGLLARQAGKPVRIELSREEVFATTRHRHPVMIDITTGVAKDGAILAQDIAFVVDNGAYRGSGPVVIFLGYTFHIPVYRVANLRYQGLAVYTNNPVKGPQRGHGAPQIRFAVDSQLCMIADELGLDPAELMLKNAREKGDVLYGTGDTLHSCGLKECIERAVAISNFKGKRKMPKPQGSKRTGLGISTCSMFSGAAYYPFASAAVVKMHDDGTATLFTGATEMGQGCDTTLAQVAAEVLGLKLEEIRLVSGDTELCPIDLGSFLSGGAMVSGKAVAAAAADARDQLIEAAAQLLEANPADLKLADKRVFVAGAPEKAVSYAQVIAASIQRRGGDSIVGKGSQKPVAEADYYPSLAKVKGRWTEAYGFAAQVAEVEVDLETAQVKVLKVVTVHDCGFPLNVQIVEGQIEGCISMGLGQVLSELVTLEHGTVYNPSFLEYHLPTSSDTPAMEIDLVHSLDPKGPFGAKEAGEGTVAGMLAAVANAIYDATGFRVKSLPVTPYLLSKGLGRKSPGISPNR